MKESSLEQYLRLYDGCRGMIEENAPAVLNSLRGEAYGVLQRDGLSGAPKENYPYTDLEKALAPDYGLNLARHIPKADPRQSFRCDVPDLSTSLFFIVNDTFLAPAEHPQLPEGVIACSLAEAARKYPEAIGKHYGSIADIANPLVALNTMLVQDGMAVIVPDGVKIEKPLQLVSIFQSSVDLMGVRRVLVVAGKGSEVQILLCDHTQNPDNSYLALQAVELIAGEDSVLNFCELEESTENTTRLSALYLSQEKGSRVNVNGITLFNGHTRNEYYCRLGGKDASLELCGLAIEDCTRTADTFSLIEHVSPECRSNELFKYVADDHSLASFSGRILVHPGASGTEAYQSNRNIAGGEGRIYSKPQLEIYNDDVKCSHGCATGKLDEEQLFYMQARGIDADDARRMLKQAFMSDVIARVGIEALRDRLRQLVAHRFGNPRQACASCASGCSLQKK